MSANQNFNHNLEISIALKKQSWKPAFSQACKKYIVNSTKRGARLYSGKHSGWSTARSDFKSPPLHQFLSSFCFTFVPIVNSAVLSAPTVHCWWTDEGEDWPTALTS